MVIDCKDVINFDFNEVCNWLVQGGHPGIFYYNEEDSFFDYSPMTTDGGKGYWSGMEQYPAWCMDADMVKGSIS